MFIDESHATIPQVRAMYNGDRARKESLIKYGFRLPSALDNRPLKFEEFEKKINKCIFFSATPAEYEMEKSDGNVVEQIIRPTGLLDPEIIVKPVTNQVDDLIEEIRIRTEKNERILVTTLTKKMAEDLTAYLANLDIKVRYMHSDIKALERMEIIRDLRIGKFDVLVRNKPFKGRIRHTRSIFSCNIRCRQRRIFTFRKVANTNNRACCKKHRRQSNNVCRRANRKYGKSNIRNK